MGLAKSAAVVALGMAASFGTCAAKLPLLNSQCDEFSVDLSDEFSTKPIQLVIPKSLYPYSNLSRLAVDNFGIEIKKTQVTVCQYQGESLRHLFFHLNVLSKLRDAKHIEPLASLMSMDVNRFGVMVGPWQLIGTTHRYGNTERLEWQRLMIDLAASQKLEVNEYGFRFVDQKAIDEAPSRSPLKELSGLFLAPPSATEPVSKLPMIFVCRERWSTEFGMSPLCSVMYDIEPGVGFFYEFFFHGPAPAHWMVVDNKVRSIAKSLLTH